MHMNASDFDMKRTFQPPIDNTSVNKHTNPAETRNMNQRRDLVKYIENLENSQVRRKLVKLLSQDLDESDIDIENIDHYLIVAHNSNSLINLKRCEKKLIENINRENREEYYQKAVRYGFEELQAVSEKLVKENYSSLQHFTSQTFKHFNDYLPINEKTARDKPYQTFFTMFNCGNSQSKRTVNVIVYDYSMNMKGSMVLHKSSKIRKQFECCCIQHGEDADPNMFWSFGKSVHQYDPILLQYHKRASLNYKRSKFSFVAHAENCYAIGGEYQMHRVYEIEKYNKNKWEKVAMLPRECLPIGCSCVVFNDCVYIFSAMVDDSNQIKKQSTGVYVFHPIQRTIKKVVEIPYYFNQIKSCVQDSFIYLASDRGLFIRFDPMHNSVCQLEDQILLSKDFGIFSLGDAIICVGGKTSDGQCTNMFRRYSTVSGLWDILPITLPTVTTICGICEIKIKTDWRGFVPFCRRDIFKK